MAERNEPTETQVKKQDEINQLADLLALQPIRCDNVKTGLNCPCPGGICGYKATYEKIKELRAMSDEDYETLLQEREATANALVEDID